MLGKAGQSGCIEMWFKIFGCIHEKYHGLVPRRPEESIRPSGNGVKGNWHYSYADAGTGIPNADPLQEQVLLTAGLSIPAFLVEKGSYVSLAQPATYLDQDSLKLTLTSPALFWKAHTTTSSSCKDCVVLADLKLLRSTCLRLQRIKGVTIARLQFLF